MVERKIGDKVLHLVHDDISAMEVDAFVYDITEDVKLGAGFGSAIQQRGGIAIQKELDAIGSCPVGEAVVTEAGLLKAKYIIHTNGPKFCEEDEEDKLRRATKAALLLAEEKDVKRLAFPPIGTGLYQVPLDLCARVMVDTITEHLRNRTGLEEVFLVTVDAREYEPFRKKLEEGV
jgi:O-acetyl-ADP-ribose deacetylase (regulator of RNase III)